MFMYIIKSFNLNVVILRLKQTEKNLLILLCYKFYFTLKVTCFLVFEISIFFGLG